MREFFGVMFTLICFLFLVNYGFKNFDKKDEQNKIQNKVLAENVVAGDYSIVDSTKSDYYIYNGKTYFWLEKKYVHAADSISHIKTIYGANRKSQKEDL